MSDIKTRPIKVMYAGLLLIAAYSPVIVGSSFVMLTVEGGVSLVGPHCPGTVRLFCEGVGLAMLRWT